MAKYAGEFVFLRCADKKTAEQLRVNKPPEVIFYDSDAEEFYRTGLSAGTPEAAATSLESVMAEALKKYASREIAWTAGGDGDGAGTTASRRLAVLAFTLEESKECEATLKAFEDRSIVKLHEKCAFVKIAFDKDSEIARKWGVTSPMVLLVDTSKEAGPKAVLDRLSGKKSPVSLKQALVKAFRKMEKEKE